MLKIVAFEILKRGDEIGAEIGAEIGEPTNFELPPFSPQATPSIDPVSLTGANEQGAGFPVELTTGCLEVCYSEKGHF